MNIIVWLFENIMKSFSRRPTFQKNAGSIQMQRISQEIVFLYRHNLVKIFRIALYTKTEVY